MGSLLVVSAAILTVGLAATTRTENVTMGGYYPGIIVSAAALGACWEGHGGLQSLLPLMGLERKAGKPLWVVVVSRICPRRHLYPPWALWLCGLLAASPKRHRHPASCGRGGVSTGGPCECRRAGARSELERGEVLVVEDAQAGHGLGARAGQTLAWT